jgi:hypothetical protein
MQLSDDPGSLGPNLIARPDYSENHTVSSDDQGGLPQTVEPHYGRQHLSGKLDTLILEKSTIAHEDCALAGSNGNPGAGMCLEVVNGIKIYLALFSLVKN